MKNMRMIVPMLMAIGALLSCSDKAGSGMEGFDPSKPIEVSGFYPDSGGIATPIIIEGANFGRDTTGMSVYFVDTVGDRYRAGLVSSNGSRIYAMVPSGLTYKRQMRIQVERKDPNGKTYSGEAKDIFMYRTQTTVTTVVGQPAPNDGNIKTVGGDLATATLSAPAYLALDDEDNIFISERRFDANSESDLTPRDDKGNANYGNLVIAYQKNNSVVVLKYGAERPNAPYYSDEEGAEAFFVPDDAGMKYYQLSKSISYSPRYLTTLKTEETRDLDNKNWKFCFVVNKKDKLLYTVMYNRQLLRINPRTRIVEVLLKKIGTENSGHYFAFSPLPGQENLMYIVQTASQQIWTVNLDDLSTKDKESYPGEYYAGKSFYEGKSAGTGWEDGLLKNAKFNSPAQCCFTKDGKFYIADVNNHCIRMIDTSVPKEKATVTTVIGIPGNKGFKDGGPEIARFFYPRGVAVSADGNIVYVADSRNKVIRKLSIQ